MDFLQISQTGLMVIIGTIALALFGIFFGLVYKGIDRKLSAHQGRIGPPIRQPFRDVVKLFTKENIVPENAIPWIFNLAPLVGLVATISILLYLPLGGFQPLFPGKGDLILILYVPWKGRSYFNSVSTNHSVSSDGNRWFLLWFTLRNDWRSKRNGNNDCL